MAHATLGRRLLLLPNRKLEFRATSCILSQGVHRIASCLIDSCLVLREAAKVLSAALQPRSLLGISTVSLCIDGQGTGMSGGCGDSQDSRLAT
jgi:hypothetical protein